MRCPNCGRENPGIRLFCSRCGELMPDSDAPISDREIQAREAPKADVTQEDDDIKIYKRPTASASKKDVDVSEPKEDKEAGLEHYVPEDTDFFKRRERVRRIYEDDWPELSARTEKKREPSRNAQPDDSPYARPKQEMERRPPTLSRREMGDTGRPSTLIPRREESVDPDNLFSVRGETPFDEDDFDRVPRAPRAQPRRRGYAYEEPESQSFFMRHVRGIVGLILLAITVTIVITWAVTPSAQRVLAQLDLAWSPSAYAKLGYEAYEVGSYDAAGRYFTMALNRDSDNYSYAIGATNSYLMSKNTKKAIAALEACIALKPDDAQLYVELLNQYGGFDNLPENARRLIQEGYERTGDSRLKQ